MQRDPLGKTSSPVPHAPRAHPTSYAPQACMTPSVMCDTGRRTVHGGEWGIADDGASRLTISVCMRLPHAPSAVRRMLYQLRCNDAVSRPQSLQMSLEVAAGAP